jgi:hypothetical protein
MERVPGKFIVRPVYVNPGPDYCLIFDRSDLRDSDGIPVPNYILKYTGPVAVAMRKFFIRQGMIGGWELASPYFADSEDVKGYRDIAIGI